MEMMDDFFPEDMCTRETCISKPALHAAPRPFRADKASVAFLFQEFKLLPDAPCIALFEQAVTRENPKAQKSQAARERDDGAFLRMKTEL